MSHMGTQQSTVTDALRANVTTLMRWRNVTAAQLGRRMEAIGFDGWKHRRTAVRFLKPAEGARKSISPDELMGLALVLDTTVEMLLSSDLDTMEKTRMLRGGYRVGDWPLHAVQIQRIVFDSDVRGNPSALTHAGIRWSPEDTPQTNIEALTIAGRSSVREALEHIGAAIPDGIDSMSLDELWELLLAVRAEREGS